MMALLRTLVSSLFLLFFFSSINAELEPRGGVCPTWAYHGEHGPAYWGALCVNWRICGRGKTKMEYNGNNIEIKWNQPGEIFKGPFGPTRVFYLNVVFFHTPAEHLVSGQRYPLEVQFIHLSDDGYMAVLSVIFDYGRSHPFLSGISPHITNATDTEVEIFSPNLAGLLKEALSDGYYYYQGSLTSPPCTQGISWVVARRIIKASAEEIDAFIPILKNNVRPTQLIGERYILEYIPFGGVDTFIFDEQSWYIKALVAFSLISLLFITMCFIYACDFALRPFMYTKKKDYSEIL